VNTRRTPGSRLARLERLARSRPCPGCGQPFHAPGTNEIDGSPLCAAERDELVGLLAASSAPACSRCGRSSHDFRRMTDDQLDRTLQLLRKLLEPTQPALASFCDALVVGRNST
jgi:hypothetical protein